MEEYPKKIDMARIIAQALLRTTEYLEDRHREVRRLMGFKKEDLKPAFDKALPVVDRLWEEGG